MFPDIVIKISQCIVIIDFISRLIKKFIPNKDN